MEAISFRMEQEGLTPRDLEPYVGQSGRVSEVLNRKRAFSLSMVKRLHDGLRISYESLLAGVLSKAWAALTPAKAHACARGRRARRSSCF